MKAVEICKKGIRTFAACLALSGVLFFGMSDTASAAEAVPSADVLISSEEMSIATQQDAQFNGISKQKTASSTKDFGT